MGSVVMDNTIKRVDLKVGYSCNNDCRFCVVAEKRKFGDKSTSRIKTDLESSYKEGKREVVFTGGECTIREDILDLVSFAKERGYSRIQIQTNGRRLASPDFAKRMIEAGMTEFAPALHGPNAKIHDYLTRSPSSWRQTVLGIYNVKKLGVCTLANTVINKYNYKYLADIADLLVRLGVNQYQFAFIHILGNAYKYYKDMVPRVSEITPFLYKGIEVGIKANAKVIVEAIPFCLMKGYEGLASDLYLPPIQLKEVTWTIDDFGPVRKNDAKKKFKKCLMCKWYSKCEGPWKEYPELFGEEEFNPVWIN